MCTWYYFVLFCCDHIIIALIITIGIIIHVDILSKILFRISSHIMYLCQVINIIIIIIIVIIIIIILIVIVIAVIAVSTFKIFFSVETLAILR